MCGNGKLYHNFMQQLPVLRNARDNHMGGKLAETAIVSRSGDHLSAKAGAQIVLMSIKQGKYAGLDPVGSAIWERLETPVSVEALCTDLLGAYEADPEILRQDVLKFLTELHSLGMIEVIA